MTAAARPDGVPDDAVPTPVTLWVTPKGVAYSPRGWDLTYNAEGHGIPVPRPPRTDPWGLGLDECDVRRWATCPTRGVAGGQLIAIHACRAVVAEWDAEGEQ